LFIPSKIQRIPQREQFANIRNTGWLLLLYRKIKLFILRNIQNAEIYLILQQAVLIKKTGFWKVKNLLAILFRFQSLLRNIIREAFPDLDLLMLIGV